ncbi:MAG: hypothetical protein U0572_09785 [Phycisphaerales bacterium]
MAKQVGLTAAVTLVGVGLILNAAARFVPSEGIAHAAPVAANAGPNPPTIVWYGLSSAGLYGPIILRAWSDGTVELKRVIAWQNPPGGNCPSGPSPDCWLNSYPPLSSPWLALSSPNDGLNAAADVNHDEQVNGADLAMLLGAWGPAPRNPTPPSDCPLELILP